MTKQEVFDLVLANYVSEAKARVAYKYGDVNGYPVMMKERDGELDDIECDKKFFEEKYSGAV